MSLLNVYLAAHRALVGVDNSCGLLPGQTLADWCAERAPGLSMPGELSKLFPIAHVGAVIACRGTALFGLEVYCAASMLPSVDAIEDSMGELLARIGAASDARHAAAHLPEDVRYVKQEIVLVGWSEREGAMIATVWERAAGPGRGFIADQVDRYVAPWDDAQGEALEPSTDEAMLTLARLQASHIRVSHAGTPIGGRLIVAEVTRDAITMRQAGQISSATRC